MEEFWQEVELELKKLEKPLTEDDIRFNKAVANWILNPITSYINKERIHISQFPVKQEYLIDLIKVVEFTDLISFNVASTVVLQEMILNPDEHSWSIMIRLNLLQSSDEDEIKNLVEEVLAKYSDKVIEYKSGKIGLFGFFVKEVLNASGKNKINPRIVSKFVKELLDKELC